MKKNFKVLAVMSIALPLLFSSCEKGENITPVEKKETVLKNPPCSAGHAECR